MAVFAGRSRQALGANAVDNAHQVRCPPGLFDVALVVAPHGGLAAPDRLDESVSAADLVSIVAQAGATDCDLRVLTAPGEQNLPMLRAVARRLGRDVLIAPTGSEIMRLPAGLPSTEDGTGGGGGDDLVPVDATTGHPVDWVAVQPSGEVGAVLSWFELVGGLVVPRTGLVVLPLPDGGRMLGTRETFVRARAAAVTLRHGHPGLVTLGVQVRSGDFVLGYYDRRTQLVDGTGLAAALSALPLYRANVRLWLRWPTAGPDRDRLRSNLADFAEVTGATVWAPVEQGEVVMLDGCLDLAALDALGDPGRWEAYGHTGSFESDLDGRLVPVGGVRVAQLSAARLVSGHAAREQELAMRAPVTAVGAPERTTAGLEPASQPFTCDLAVLADGRLAVRHRDGSLLAVGGLQFAQLLRDAGWTGSDVLRLSPVTPEQAAGTTRHLADLAAHLGVPIRLAHAEDAARPTPALEEPLPFPMQTAPVRPATRRPELVAGPATVPLRQPPVSPSIGLPVPPQPFAEPEPEPEREPKDSGTAPLDLQPARTSIAHQLIPQTPPPPVAQSVAALGATEAAALPNAVVPPVDRPLPLPDVAKGEWEAAKPDQDPFGPLFGPVGRTRLIDGPRLMPASPTPPHGLAWLPAQPQTNAEQFDLFVACDPDPGAAIVSGVPSPELFLAGHLDADLLAERTAAAHLLQVRVAPGGAIDVVATDVAPPAEIAPLLKFKDVYVLPPGWLSRCEVVATYRVTRDHASVRQSRHAGLPLLLTPAGASHGVPGLPASAARWPQGRIRGASRYVVVAEITPERPWLPLAAERPTPSEGTVLAEVRLERNQAIDVGATAAALADLPAVRSTAAELVASGIDVLLPAEAFATVTVRKAWRGDGRTWRELTLGRSQRLDAWLEEHRLSHSR